MSAQLDLTHPHTLLDIDDTAASRAASSTYPTPLFGSAPRHPAAASRPSSPWPAPSESDERASSPRYTWASPTPDTKASTAASGSSSTAPTDFTPPTQPSA